MMRGQLTDRLFNEFNASLSDFRFKSSPGCAYTACALILLGIGLDYSLYPQELLPFVIARLVCITAILSIIRLLKTGFGRIYVHELTFAWLLCSQIMICWMIYSTDGAASSYYIGLPLAIFGSGIVLAFGVWQNTLFSILTYLIYLVACAIHPNGIGFETNFLTSSLFLIMFSVISIVYTVYNERARFSLFRLKAEVAEKNTLLEQTNKNLAEIKGQMLQQEKMASIGTLAAGLLHEVNNPVNYCLMAISIAMEEPAVKTTQSLKECLVDAQHEHAAHSAHCFRP